jgi:hypothetical protein
MGIQLLHFPYCTIDRRYWKNTLKNPYPGQASACRSCRKAEDCPGILESYINEFGEEEFRSL